MGKVLPLHGKRKWHISQVVDWVREGLFRLLGVLSAFSLTVHRIRVPIPLSWVLLLLLAFLSIRTLTTGFGLFETSMAPQKSIQELVTTTESDGQVYRVSGLAYKDAGYELYLTYEGNFGTSREILQGFYFLVDPVSWLGILVASEEPLERNAQEPLPPVQTTVAGRLADMDSRVHGQMIRDGWSNPTDIQVSLHWVLEEEELRFPFRELFFLTLITLTIGFLLLTPLFNYILFWPEPNGEIGSVDPSIDPVRKLDMQVTASLPVTGRRHWVQLVESLALLRVADGGWNIITFDESSRTDLSVFLDSQDIEQITPGRVYFGRHPRWGLWIVCRDSQKSSQRLCLSFYYLQERRAVYDLLTGRQKPDA